MKETIKGIGVVLLIGTILFGIGSCTVWKWNECRNVGHGITYCIIHQVN